MRRDRWFFGWVLLVLAGTLVGWFSRGFASERALPGSEGDPLVTRSYVDSCLSAFKPWPLEIVEMGVGQRLVAGAGTEVILRAGQATAIDSPNGGLADVTSGRDLKRGDKVEGNHLLIVPRDDGRGLLAVTPVVLMVKGVYTVQDEP